MKYIALVTHLVENSSQIPHACVSFEAVITVRIWKNIVSFHSYPFKLEVACEYSSLVGVHTLAAIEELWHESRVEGIKVNRGHIVNSEGDFLLKKVVTFVEKDLQQHVDKVEEHRGPEKLLKTR